MGKEKLLLATGLGLLAIALILGAAIATPILGHWSGSYYQPLAGYSLQTSKPLNQLPITMMGDNIGGMMDNGMGMMGGGSGMMGGGSGMMGGGSGMMEHQHNSGDDSGDNSKAFECPMMD